MSRDMGAQLEDLTRRICEVADCDFNINSPRQLGEILFDKLNLPRPRKLRKSGQYSTAVEILEELAGEHELPRLVLEYRQLSKFKSTYIDVIPKLIDPNTQRLHTSFHQAAASTGRLSSSNPNLQNIPVRADLGRKIRGAFIPEEGWWFVSADYSQVELRILAHLSGDERLAAAFSAGDRETVGLLGPNGAGKTTIVETIAGLVPAASGRILLDDEPIHDLPPERRPIGIAFQDGVLFPHLSVMENVAFPVRARGARSRAARARALELLEWLAPGIDPGAKPGTLSGGERQRVALARALAGTPRVTVHTNSRAKAFTTMVTRNNANPISTSALRYRLPVASLNSLAITLAMV